MSVIARLWPDNPVLTKELRVRMRGTRAYWILTGYLAFLSFILFIYYSQWWSSAQSQGGGFSMGSKVGQGFFLAIFFTQLALVAFITPAITSGAITIEKEQRTMEMLEMTRLARSSIVAGKLLSAISFVALLLVSSLPLTSICFFLGGVSPEEVVLRYSLLLGVAFLAATIGLVWSSIARTTAAAVVFTYASLILPFFGIMGLTAAAGSASMGSGAHNLEVLWFVLMGMYGVYDASWTSFSQAGGILHAWDMRHYFAFTLPAWVAPVSTYAIIGITLAAVATARLETFPERSAWKLRLLVLGVILQQTFFLLGARFAVYAPGAPPGAANGSGNYPLIFMLSFPVGLLLCIIPIFATGEIRPIEARGFAGYLLHGWSPRGWLRAGRLSSGLPYLLVVAFAILAIFCLSFLLVGKPGGIVSGTLGPPSVAAPPGPAQAGTPGGVQPGAPQAQPLGPDGQPLGAATPAGAPAVQSGRNVIKLGAALGATVLGLWSIGLLFSVLTRSRWAALALLYAVLLCILVAPPIARVSAANASPPGAPSIFINLYYLNPLTAISEMSDTSGTFWNDMTLMFGHTPVWAVTCVVYLFISGIALVMALPFITKIAGRRALPYEDMHARV